MSSHSLTYSASHAPLFNLFWGDDFTHYMDSQCIGEGTRFKILYGSQNGFHPVDFDIHIIWWNQKLTLSFIYFTLLYNTKYNTLSGGNEAFDFSTFRELKGKK